MFERNDSVLEIQEPVFRALRTCSKSFVRYNKLPQEPTENTERGLMNYLINPDIF